MSNGETTGNDGTMIERRPGVGRYAHLEREQRWLLARRPDVAVRMASIRDRYLTGTRLRLRHLEQTDGTVHLKLAQKVRLDLASGVGLDDSIATGLSVRIRLGSSRRYRPANGCRVG